jgi:hypothetical protein
LEQQLDGNHKVPVSPLHTVTVGEEYLAMVERAPQQDFVVRTLARQMAGDTPLMSGDLVIAGRWTRETFPLAASFPLHFRKTYHIGRLRGDPRLEFEHHARASEVLGIPPPIGHTPSTFRSCLIPGRPLDQVLSPFGSEPEESNVRHADKLSLANAAGLWLLLERVMGSLSTLHAAGLTHGDAELHNFIVCNAPVDVLPIDFDMAVLRGDIGQEAWDELLVKDLTPLLRVAVYLQCALGAQTGPLGELSLSKLETLFAHPKAFVRAIESRAALLTAH